MAKLQFGDLEDKVKAVKRAQTYLVDIQNVSCKTKTNKQNEDFTSEKET